MHFSSNVTGNLHMWQFETKSDGAVKLIYVVWESNLQFLFAVFYPNLHIIFNFALDQATACLRRLICLAFRRFGFKPV